MVKWFLERTEAERWAIGVVAAFTGAFFVQWFAQRLNHALAIQRDRRNNLTAASIAFRTAINPELFNEMRGHYLHAALAQTFPDLKKAVHEFRLHLGVAGKISLNRAWKEYHGGEEEYPDFFKTYCIPDHGPSLLKQRLENLRKAGEIT
jgi:hypothetical protein